MAETHEHSETPADRIWREYGQAFRAFDDITLARWCSQTLGQLHGKAWRMSHPLVASLRLAAQVAHERSLWQQRLVNAPMGYPLAECCGPAGSPADRGRLLPAAAAGKGGGARARRSINDATTTTTTRAPKNPSSPRRRHHHR